MIEKLKARKRDDGFLEPATPSDIYWKINELVDAVNNIISVQEKLIDSRFVVETKHEAKENVQPDEIEQAEKWVGKLCWFSQLYGCYQHIAILKRISESGLYVTDDGELHYAYCEPVKPDDDIIYKGGDNE